MSYRIPTLHALARAACSMSNEIAHVIWLGRTTVRDEYRVCSVRVRLMSLGPGRVASLTWVGAPDLCLVSVTVSCYSCARTQHHTVQLTAFSCVRKPLECKKNDQVLALTSYTAHGCPGNRRGFGSASRSMCALLSGSAQTGSSAYGYALRPCPMTGL